VGGGLTGRSIIAAVTRLTDLYQALPIAGARVRTGNQTGCGGIADARIDIEAAQAYEFVDATPPHPADQELADFCVTHVRDGVELELAELFGALPPVRVTLHQILAHQVDSNESVNRRAGRSAVQQALRASGLGHTLPSPEAGYRVIPPRPS
jgi:hypothetical protein